jgi:hypothetical protein
MSINSATIDAYIFDVVKTTLVAAALKTTDGAGSQSTVTVAASYNDNLLTRPSIVIEPMNSDDGKRRFGGSSKEEMINVVLSCYAPTTLAVDQISGAVGSLFDTTDIGVELVGISKDYSFGEFNQNKFHTKTITLHYRRE